MPGVTRSRTAPVAYADALLGELTDLEAAYLAVLQVSTIERYAPVPSVIGLPPWGCHVFRVS